MFVIIIISLKISRCRSNSRGDNLNNIGLAAQQHNMEINGSHRSLQQQPQQRIPNGNGRDHWSKMPDPQNGHDPKVSSSSTFKLFFFLNRKRTEIQTFYQNFRFHQVQHQAVKRRTPIRQVTQDVMRLQSIRRVVPKGYHKVSATSKEQMDPHRGI